MKKLLFILFVLLCFIYISCETTNHAVTKIEPEELNIFNYDNSKNSIYNRIYYVEDTGLLNDYANTIIGIASLTTESELEYKVLNKAAQKSNELGYQYINVLQSKGKRTKNSYGLYYTFSIYFIPITKEEAASSNSELSNFKTTIIKNSLIEKMSKSDKNNKRTNTGSILKNLGEGLTESSKIINSN